MNKPMQLLLFAAATILPAAAAAPTVSYVAQVSYDAGNVSIGTVRLVNASPPVQWYGRGDAYTARVVASNGTVVHKRPFSFPLVEYVRAEEPRYRDTAVTTVTLPYHGAGTELVVAAPDGNQVAAASIAQFAACPQGENCPPGASNSPGAPQVIAVLLALAVLAAVGYGIARAGDRIRVR